ncbi:hypothetical protein [Streptomyces flaveolus]|uniref:hypothetical protein n=1 Tax=Streptomyces flaveolus TaxID=67297 RepID=UPI00333180F3
METSQYIVDLHVLGASVGRERPAKKLEDELTKMRRLLKAFGDNYEAANRPAIRQDVRRCREEAERQYGELQRRIQGDGQPTGDPDVT